MTELEKIEYAKSFIDKLANGINPLDDSPIPDNDIANNVRLSRCFFYVSDILRQVIENGGTTSSKKKTKNAFISKFIFKHKKIPHPLKYTKNGVVYNLFNILYYLGNSVAHIRNQIWNMIYLYPFV